MDLDEALRLADEICDPDDGGVETLMDQGIDVMEALRDAVRELQARCTGRAEPPTAAEVDALTNDGAGAFCFRFLTEGAGLRFTGTARTVHDVQRAAHHVGAPHGATHGATRWWVERRDGCILPWSIVAPRSTP